MASMTLNSKRVTLSIEEKAKLLRVVDVHEPGVLAVVSGSDSRIAYAVSYDLDSFQITNCACTGCKEYGRTHCAYRVAVRRYLHMIYRDMFPTDFN